MALSLNACSFFLSSLMHVKILMYTVINNESYELSWFL
jgi:hypothetical protein